jgi:hypothetical protein
LGEWYTTSPEAADYKIDSNGSVEITQGGAFIRGAYIAKDGAFSQYIRTSGGDDYLQTYAYKVIDNNTIRLTEVTSFDEASGAVTFGASANLYRKQGSTPITTNTPTDMTQNDYAVAMGIIGPWAMHTEVTVEGFPITYDVIYMISSDGSAPFIATVTGIGTMSGTGYYSIIDEVLLSLEPPYGAGAMKLDRQLDGNITITEKEANAEGKQVDSAVTAKLVPVRYQ